MPKRKLLLLSISTGAGHVRAAEALRETANRLHGDTIDVSHIDIATFLTRSERRAVIDFYELMATKLPDVWGFFYDVTDHPKRSVMLRKLFVYLHRKSVDRLATAIRTFAPDHILHTHPLPAMFLTQNPPPLLPQATPMSIVVTDYDFHTFWLVPDLSHYFVATDKMKWKMVRGGIDEHRVIVSGIPIHPMFREEKSTSALQKKYHSQGGQKHVLILSGGYGMMQSDKIVKALFASPEPLMITVIAGKNKKLEEKLRHLIPPPHITLAIVGWTDTIDEYLRIADVVVTKTGGLTTTECVALKKPVIAVAPIPGQEEYNIRYLQEQGYGVLASTVSDLIYFVEQGPQIVAPGYEKKMDFNLDSSKDILETIF